MSLNCPACGLRHEAGMRFCGHCGQLLGPVQTPSVPVLPEQERKQVTILFVDVAWSMELAERLDPDTWSSIVDRLAALCREAVGRTGGTVDKLTGDGLMALFGAPVTEEDHAARACHAVLQILEAAAGYARELAGSGVELAVRVGLNSGEVVAGTVGGSAYTAVGHTVGLAQRMEGLAAPGSAYLSEHTARLVTSDFRLRPLGPVPVKGSATARGVFVLEAALGGPSAAGRRRQASTVRFVGRDAELDRLTAAMDEALPGTGSVVGVVGEAGAGKTRLCDELAQLATAANLTVRRTAGVSHASAVPLLPILSFMRDYFAIRNDDSPAEARTKIAGRLLDLEAGFAADLGLIFDFMEVPDPADPAPA